MQKSKKKRHGWDFPAQLREGEAAEGASTTLFRRQPAGIEAMDFRCNKDPGWKEMRVTHTLLHVKHTSAADSSSFFS